MATNMHRYKHSRVHDRLYGVDGETVTGHAFTCTHCALFVVTSSERDDAEAAMYLHFVARHLTGNTYASGAKRRSSTKSQVPRVEVSPDPSTEKPDTLTSRLVEKVKEKRK